MPNRILQLFATTCLLMHCNAVMGAVIGADGDVLSVAGLFDESIVADNAAAVCKRSTRLHDDKRLSILLRWVLPSEHHATIRMTGDFTQTDPAPGNEFDASEEQAHGGRIVSPVFDLLELAKRLNRLPELRQKVDAIPEPSTDEQQRAKAALQAMIHFELGNSDEAAKATDRLLQLVRASRPKSVAEMWPETLVVFRHVVRKQTAPGNDELLGFLFSQRTQLDFLPNELRWHTQIASLAGEHGHRESKAPTVSSPEELEMTQWVPISRRRALTRGQGLARSRWGRAGSQVFKISGHDDDYLFFRSPLTGDYEVQCDVTAFTTQTMAAGTFVGNDGDRSHLWVGTLRNSASRVESNVKFSGFDDWIHQRSVVRDGICKTSLNGLVVHTEQSTSSLDPWYAVRSWWRMHAAARDIRISGNPVIPDSVDLSAIEDLRGWYPYFEESAGTPGAVWEHLPDENSSGVILGHSGAPDGSFCESLLAYQRPLDSVGSIEYEFFYEPGKTEVHPALDRMVFCLQPDRVLIHWLTDGSLDRAALGPENLIELPPSDLSSSPLPLQPDEWNRLKIEVHDNKATLQLNGLQICETSIEAFNDRVFGLFHYSDQTEAKVRNVKMRGSWLKTLPGLKEQEAADKRPGELDADLLKLSDVFTHDFASGGVPAQFFTRGQNHPAGTFDATTKGWNIRRPGGGSWLDSWVNLPFMVHGDFDVEFAFEDFRAVGDGHGCIMLVVELDDKKRTQCRILRMRDDLQHQSLQSSLSEIHQDGGRSYSARPPKKTEAVAGRLRMARRGTTLYYLAAENDSAEFRILESEEISDISSVADGLHFHAMCNGKGETSVLWTSISVRAERLTLKPDANAKQLTNLYIMNADGSNVRKLAEPRPGYSQLGSFEWSADGRQLIGDMSKGGVDTSQILILNADGSNVRVIGEGCMPSLSADASEVVFSQASFGVMKMTSDGKQRQTIGPGGWGVQWSPNGRTMAIAGGNNITMLDVASQDRTMLLTDKQAANLRSIFWNFGWSGDSRSIAFKATLKSGDCAVVVLDVDDPNSLQTVYSSPLYFPEDISLSPDGKSVIFPAFTPDRTRASMMFVDRKNLNPAFPFLAQFQNWNITGVDWSPDGKSIVFTATPSADTTEWPLE